MLWVLGFAGTTIMYILVINWGQINSGIILPILLVYGRLSSGTDLPERSEDTYNRLSNM